MYTEELTGRLVDGEPEWVAKDGRTFIVGRRGQVWTGKIKGLELPLPHEGPRLKLFPKGPLNDHQRRD